MGTTLPLSGLFTRPLSTPSTPFVPVFPENNSLLSWLEAYKKDRFADGGPVTAMSEEEAKSKLYQFMDRMVPKVMENIPVMGLTTKIPNVVTQLGEEAVKRYQTAREALKELSARAEKAREIAKDPAAGATARGAAREELEAIKAQQGPLRDQLTESMGIPPVKRAEGSPEQGERTLTGDEQAMSDVLMGALGFNQRVPQTYIEGMGLEELRALRDKVNEEGAPQDRPDLNEEIRDMLTGSRMEQLRKQSVIADKLSAAEQLAALEQMKLADVEFQQAVASRTGGKVAPMDRYVFDYMRAGDEERPPAFIHGFKTPGLLAGRGVYEAKDIMGDTHYLQHGTNEIHSVNPENWNPYTQGHETRHFFDESAVENDDTEVNQRLSDAAYLTSSTDWKEAVNGFADYEGADITNKKDFDFQEDLLLARLGEEAAKGALDKGLIRQQQYWFRRYVDKFGEPPIPEKSNASR